MSDTSIANKTQELAPFNVPQGMVNLNEISHMLLEQMKEVKNNPAAIPQAECAAMVAGRIVDIAKTQVAQAQVIAEMIRTKNGI